MPADDPARVADAIDRVARGAIAYLVRDGPHGRRPHPLQPLQVRRDGANRSAPVERAAVDAAGAAAISDTAAGAPLPDAGVDLDAREARAARRGPHSVHAGLVHAARFGAPTLEHDRRTYSVAGFGWRGEAFVRRDYPLADSAGAPRS